MGALVCDELCCLWFALLQPSKRCFAITTIVLLESVTCCHSLRFLDFYVLHKIMVISFVWAAADTCSNRLKKKGWCIIKLVQKRFNLMSDICGAPCINCSTTMKENMVNIFVWIIACNTLLQAIYTSLVQFHTRRKSISTDPPYQVIYL